MKKFENAAMPKSTLAYRVLSPPALLRQTGTRLAQRANQLDQRPHRRLESRWRGRENHRAPSQTVASRNALKGKMRTAAQKRFHTLGDRGREGFWPPLPPNRTCGSPAYGSPVAGFLIGDVLVVRGLCRRVTVLVFRRRRW